MSARTLQAALSRAVQTSFDMLTVDGDMSTNDAVFALANGLAANAPVVEGTPEFEALVETLEALCIDLARQIAEDGDGATKLIEVRIAGAPDAGDGARARARRRRVDARQGRDLRRRPELGPRAGRDRRARGVAQAGRSTRRCATVHVQGTCVYLDRAPTGADALALRAKMRDPSCSSRCASPRATRRRPRGAAISATTS